ncbi:DUF29 domain-containing protein [Trichothermofontia sp.]
MTNHYDRDFNQWAQATAQRLRERRWHELDLDHLIEEVESLGKSEGRAISSQLERILIHLLKWAYQPQRRSDSWLDAITDGRIQIEKIIRDNPSLQDFPAACLAADYVDAMPVATQLNKLALVSTNAQLNVPTRSPISSQAIGYRMPRIPIKTPNEPDG